MNTIFGPVNSRRFGKSLGIDLSPTKKQCNFDCLYCELEPAKTMDYYENVVSVEEIMRTLRSYLATYCDIDVLTITANGEPTLYPHLGELMDEINSIKGDLKTLILSNAGTIDNPHTQEVLMKFDTVKLSLDCATPRCLKRLDRAHKGIDVEQIKEGMLRFKKRYMGELIIEILMVEGINDAETEIEALNGFLKQLQPTRIDLGTIDRPPAYAVKPLSYEELHGIALRFDASLPIYIASRQKGEVKPSTYSDESIVQTLKKRPLTQEDVEVLFDLASQKRLRELVQSGKIAVRKSSGYDFFVHNG